MFCSTQCQFLYSLNLRSEKALPTSMQAIMPIHFSKENIHFQYLYRLIYFVFDSVKLSCVATFSFKHLKYTISLGTISFVIQTTPRMHCYKLWPTWDWLSEMNGRIMRLSQKCMKLGLEMKFQLLSHKRQVQSLNKSMQGHKLIARRNIQWQD